MKIENTKISKSTAASRNLNASLLKSVPQSARGLNGEPGNRVLQRAMGNTLVSRLPPAQAGVQTKLKVGAPDDRYEREADSMADRIMRMPAPPQPPDDVSGGAVNVQRKCAACAHEDEDTVRRKPAAAGAPIASTPPSLSPIQNGGRPLDAQTRGFFEPRFNADFSGVRIHAGAEANRSAEQLSALAYTAGPHIVFRSGYYEPASESGKRLLAHELTHVLQQRGPAAGRGEGAGGDTHDAPVVQRALAPMIMRTTLFSSTLEICHRLLESRVFHVSEGGLRVSASAAYEQRGSPECSTADYHMTLNQQGIIYNSEYGTCDFLQGDVFSRQWTELPEGDYNLTIWTNNTNPYCCLVGDIVVEQDSAFEGESCTQLPPTPLEILHTALDLAGLIPALGAVPDTINAGIYIIEGDWANAGLSAVAIIPIFGDAASVARIGARTVVRISGEGIQRVGREGIEAGLREARAAESAAGTARRIDPEIDDMVERGILEESTTTTGPARRPRPTAPAVRGSAAEAREAFDRVRDGYARRLGVEAGGQVHHAIELQSLDRYPGVFSADELNDFANMRGITPELVRRQQLHGSAIRRTLDRHYRQLDREIAERGLVPGTAAYNDYVRRYLESARDEIDNVYGQFFSESRRALGTE